MSELDGQQGGRRELVELSRAEALRIVAEGAAAFRAGEPSRACPYSPRGNATERVRVQAWLRGWLTAQRTDVD